MVHPKTMTWAHAAPTLLASFLASLVECVEALTVILAVGSVRSWSAALSGAAAALAVILVLVATLGRALTRVPLGALQLVIGVLLLLFGLRWLRKAILRAAGHIPLHDEQAAFAKNTASLKTLGRTTGWDRVAFAAAFNITMLEGTEVVFIVVAIGAGGAGLLLPAGLGAVAALLVVSALGAALHRPLTRVPENALKFVVGVLLSAFGTFWVGEGAGLAWPGADWSIPGLVAAYLLIALITVALCRAELVVPESVAHAPAAVVKVAQMPLSGGGMALATFASGRYEYSVYSAISGRWGLKSGVAIDRDGERIGARRCDRGKEGDFAAGFIERPGLLEAPSQFQLPD